MNNPKILTVGQNNSSLILRLTEHLKVLNIKKGDKVFVNIQDDKIVINKLTFTGKNDIL